MRLTDEAVIKHLSNGGRIRLAKISWCYARLFSDQLFWFLNGSDKLVAPVQGFSEIVSQEWTLCSSTKT